MADRETDQPAGSTSATDADTKSANEEPLGEGGKRALDSERAARREAEKRLQKAEERVKELELAEVRREVAAAKGLTDDQGRFLTGDSKEELEQAADGLLDAFGARRDATRGKGTKEDLRSGASNEEDAEPDASKVADRILSRSAF